MVISTPTAPVTTFADSALAIACSYTNGIEPVNQRCVLAQPAGRGSASCTISQFRRRIEGAGSQVLDVGFLHPGT
jgi:hypothetical protein